MFETSEYQQIIIPLIVAIVTQIIKLSIDTIKGNLNLKNIFLSYGGMPSAHTALAVSMSTMAAISEGVDSAVFAVAFIFTLIIIRDAVTFRNLLGEQGKLLNQMIKKMPSQKQKKFPMFLERIGHSVSEVLIGAMWGAGSTLIFYYLFNI